ncbi:MAG: competence protein ComEC, partial [Pseudolabrys sp.]
SGVRCDEDGCIGQLAGGKLVSMALSAGAFEEDCTRATVVISAREAPAKCAAILIDRGIWRANGAMALRLEDNHFEQSAARPAGYERPWTRAPHAAKAVSATPPAPRDATPRTEDLEVGD